MALSVTTDFLTLHDGSDVTDPSGAAWSGGGQIGLEDGFAKHGSTCVGTTVRSTGLTTLTLTLPSAQDLSANPHLRIWFMHNVPNTLDTTANGGLQLWATDGSNTGYWYVSGSDRHTGYWEQLVADLNAPPDAGTAPNLTAITQVGVRINKVSASKNVRNTWVDVTRVGGFMYVEGGTSGAPGTFADLLSVDDANAYGIVERLNGVYFLAGRIVFRPNTQDLYFKDTGQAVVFKDLLVAQSLYGFEVQAGSFAASIELGEKIGGSGINGCYMAAAGSAQFDLAFGDAGSNPNTLGLYGCTISTNGGQIVLPSNTASREVRGCVFSGCGEIIANSCVFEENTIIAPADRGVRMTTGHNIKNCSFVATPHGVHIPEDGTFTFDGLTFSGTDGVTLYDVEHSTGGALTVNNVNGSNAQYADDTGGGTTTFQNAVYITITVVDQQNNPIQNAQVYVAKSSDGTPLMNQDSDASGVAQTTYNYTADTPVRIRVRKSSPGDTRYVPLDTVGTITVNGLTTTVVLQPDTVA